MAYAVDERVAEGVTSLASVSADAIPVVLLAAQERPERGEALCAPLIRRHQPTLVQ